MRRDFENQLSLHHFLSFAGLVAFARWLDPIPSRTRPSNASAPMVLCLKTWESRSPPGLQRTEKSSSRQKNNRACLKSTPFRPSKKPNTGENSDAGWSSPVARQAHNLKVTGSNPVPATKSTERNVRAAKAVPPGTAFCVSKVISRSVCMQQGCSWEDSSRHRRDI